MARKRRPRKAVHTALLRSAHKDGTYHALLAAQNGRCAICKRTPEEVAMTSKTGKVQRLDIDHHHGSLVIRGLLCRGDNLKLRRGINSAWLRSAAAYLERAGE